MFSSMRRELRYLWQHKWDLSMLTLAPLIIIVLFASMFYAGQARHLPIAIVDQDHSQLSQTIQQRLRQNNTLHIQYVTTQTAEAEHWLNSTKIWGYVSIPEGAEQRLVKGQDAHIGIFYNQAFYSIGNSISTAMQLATYQASLSYLQEDYLKNSLPYLDAPLPHLKVSALYNPSLSYEFFLEPFIIPAMLHLLLCCTVAFSVGQELKRKTVDTWLNTSTFNALLGKILVHVFIVCFWTWAWMYWLIFFRGWFVAGSVWLILTAQFLMYFIYACISCVIVLATKDLNKSFGVIAIYGGSSLSFAGVTLPVNNAPLFTRFWSELLPYTPYVKLQTQQWVVGSSWTVSILPLLILVISAVFYLGLSQWLASKIKKATGV
ncbi:ABC transporter permease [Acinetobacter sp. MD2(2019)]|uniref:ABC transporter permease n=1 Tax=Acinetobacter sp. MD2(2019) TaxID=2605273 RepID=UPI002D1F2B7A|nr:ABC transporter permease [Acinetobacter sp. MD2(2019)]MEB3753461.1 ABC transporter permease [Acinetobacter sp. MD2(2019)]